MIWTPYDWLHESYNFYMATVVSIVVDMALELKYIFTVVKTLVHVSNNM